MERKVALITGGGTGVGRAVAVSLTAKGIACGINYSKSRHDAEETVKQIEADGGSAIALQADIADDAAVREMVKQLIDHYGRLDYLVNNAGRTFFIPLDDMEAVKDEHWDSIMGVNVKGTFHVTRACASYLKSAGGAVVNVSSIAGLTGRGSSIPYCVSKGGIETLTKSLAHVLSPEVRVNGVAPGVITTRWQDGKEKAVESHKEIVPLKRVSSPEDVAEVINGLLLNSNMVTGQTIVIDGGFTL